MQKESNQRKPGLVAAALVAVFAALVCVVATPAPALAIDVYVAHSLDDAGNRTDYKTVADAIKDGYNGKKIFMDADWPVEVYSHGDDMDLGGITVEAGKKLTIDMNGHKIYNKGKDSVSGYTDTPTISVQKNAELVLTANSTARQTEITYKGFDSTEETDEGDRVDYTVTTGGLVTNTSNWMPGILVCESGKVTLDGVTVAGCYGASTYTDNKYNQRHHTLKALHGAVTLSKGSTLNMKNGASIEHNATFEDGAGVNISGSNVTVNLEGGSSIHHNRAFANSGNIGCGGGICSKSSGTRITMSGDSKIYSNMADAGGGICFEEGGFTVTSSDGNATISSNRAVHSDKYESRGSQSGGGILVSGSGGGTIENITISENYSAYDGGGIELDKGKVTVRNCTITGNKCYYEGGGVCVSSDGNVIDNCTITGNYCDGAEKNYEGGGVFVGCQYDIGMCGTCVIKGNTRRANSGDADDVFLNANVGATMKAYIVGTLESGSSVGVRTGTTGDRRVAKGFKPKSKDCLFYDMSGYYVSYGSDENGDAWQRHREIEFLAQVNGLGNTRYKQDAAVALSGALQGTDAVFWHWDASSTAGLNPVSDYITAQNAYNPILSFKMPQNDVDARAVYATRVKKVLLAVNAPEAGEPLPSTAVLARSDDGVGGNVGLTVPVTWYEVDGERKSIAAGTAKGGTVYAASVSCTQLPQIGLYFSQGISAQDVTVRPSSGADAASSSASVDASTGTLTVVTEVFAKTADASGVVATDTATVKLEGDSLASVIGGDPSGALAASGLSDEPQASRAPLGELSVSYAKGSANISIAAPAKAGYNFCNWENVEESWVSDDVEGVVTVPAADVERIGDLVAVYTPVVTEVEVGLSSPVAAQSLDKSATKLLLKGSNDEQIELVDTIGEGSLPVVWSPGAEEDGTANYSTAYAALVQIDDGEGYEGVEDVLAPNAVVKVNGGGQAASAGFTVADGKLCLALSFDKTRAVKATSVTAPEDVELTFEEAAAYQAEQEGDPDENCWPLGRIAVIALENGEAADGDITWEAVTGFDPDATTAQELTVKGTFEVAYCDEVDDSGISHEVACKIKIAAPTQGGGEDGGKTPAVNPDDGNGQPAAGDEGDGQPASDAANKSALAKTSDSIPVLAVAAVVAIAIAAIAVAIVAARRSRNR